MPVTLDLKPLAPVKLHVQILWALLEDEEFNMAVCWYRRFMNSFIYGRLCWHGVICSILSLKINWSLFFCFHFAAKPFTCGCLISKLDSCGNRKVTAFIIAVSQLLFCASLMSINFVDQSPHFCRKPNLKYFLFKFPNEPPSLRLYLWSKSLSNSQVDCCNTIPVYEGF